MQSESLASERWGGHWRCESGCNAAPGRPARKGVTLIELLCVLAIISILASMLLPAVMRAYNRAIAMTDEFEAPAVAEMLRNHARNYCIANPQYYFTNSSDFSAKCELPAKCRAWLWKRTTVFIPFTYLDPTNQVVLSVCLGRRQTLLYAFTKGDLSTRPD